MTGDFCYAGERFADIQILRYQLNDFGHLEFRQKLYIYYLAEATLWGRDITFDQNGMYNLRIRKLTEVVYSFLKGMEPTDDSRALEVYLKRLWFSNGIHHHYGGEKFIPGFSEQFLRDMVQRIDPGLLPLGKGQTPQQLLDVLIPVMFDPDVLPKRVNKADGVDLVLTSACNFYEGVTQAEVEAFYAARKSNDDSRQPSWGLNSKLVKENGRLVEKVWKADGMYAEAISHIVYWLGKAAEVAENDQQREVIRLLVNYYQTGDLRDFDR